MKTTKKWSKMLMMGVLTVVVVFSVSAKPNKQSKLDGVAKTEYEQFFSELQSKGLPIAIYKVQTGTP